eukprot:CAMPEP_0194130242 /NCGR_PEP_ID=MMETSP0152-20130528/1320_1 /TAXON_ID=1049557 /ORGANISM="Thalassiothrix antarctica, Strain L6-D1" /LENGTH=187 /DNA_ID=CAMNT_0038824685 /DNA_START=43 /DNA_END=606 /DNA_ORIENTATION=+
MMRKFLPSNRQNLSPLTMPIIRRYLSAETATKKDEEKKEWIPPPHPTEFLSPKVEELYYELIGMESVERKLLVKITLAEIGVDVEKDEERKAAFLEKLKAAGAVKAVAKVEEVVEVKTSFDLKLVGFDAKSKIKVIKEVRAIGGLGLKEAKELVEGAPKVIKKDLKKEAAEELKKKLEEIGAKIEIS